MIKIPRYIHPLAFSAAWMVSVMAMTFSLNNKNAAGILYEVPKSVLAINMSGHAEYPTTINNPMIGKYQTDIQNAFVAGIARADMDVVGKNSSDDSTALLNAVNAVLNKHLANEEGRWWIKQGYALQVLQLTFMANVNDASNAVLDSAMQFYWDLPKFEAKTRHTYSVDERYWRLHSDLLSLGDEHVYTETSIQTVIATLDSMKELLLTPSICSNQMQC